MYDVQVMLEEAIEKTKDIEVCGMKNILSEYLQYCKQQNEKEVETILYNIIYYTIAAKHNFKGDYYENANKVTEGICELESIVTTNPSLRSYAESVLNSIKEFVITVFTKTWHIDVTNSDLEDVKSISTILLEDFTL